MDTPFDYDLAFSRNIGWVTAAEQQRLRGSRVAIAGMGGVGGVHLLTMVRLGVGAFHIADMDIFGVENFNRQAGAAMSTIGQTKVDVMAALARDINPHVDLKVFSHGVSKENLTDFLDGVDLYIDGLDFFAFSARQATFSECARRSVPAITAAPLGMGAGLINFIPGGITFDEYFGWGNLPDEEKALRFLVGLAPAGLHGRYLVEPSAVSFSERRGPSSVMGCQLCAGIAATEALKLLLKRGKVWQAPYALQFDAFRNRLIRTWRPGGNNHPIQRLALGIARRRFARATNPASLA